jgi:hypothetical protein
MHALIEAISDADMTAQPAGLNNHAAWTLGHLTHSMQAIGEQLGIEHWLPASWAERYGQGSVPSPERAEYPPKAVLVAKFEDATARVVARPQEMTPAELLAELPDERYRGRYPTIGQAAVHILASHFALHMGQLGCWRQALDTPQDTQG